MLATGILSCPIVHYTFILAFRNSPVHVFNSVLVFQRIHALCYPELACIYSSSGSFSCNIASKPSTISFLLTISELDPLVRSGLHSAAVSTIPLPIIVVIL